MLPTFDKPIDFWIGIPIFVIILMSAVFVHELGHFLLAKLSKVKVEEFALGFPPRLISFRRGETVYSLNLLPFGGYCKMLGEEDPTQPRSFARASKLSRVLILVAGVTMNVLLAIVLFTFAFVTGEPRANGELVAKNVLPNTAAAEAGMQSGDSILKMNGVTVRHPDELRAAVNASNGKQTDIVIKRGSEERTLSITPRLDQSANRYLIGVETDFKGEVNIIPNPRPLLEAIPLGLRTTWTFISMTLMLPVMAIQGTIAPEAARPVSIIGVGQLAADAATYSVNSGWWWPVLIIAGMLNIGLAIANILPLPALDGGRLAFVLVEAIRGRRVSPEKEGLVHLIGFGVLLMLMLVVMAVDITSPVPRIWGAR